MRGYRANLVAKTGVQFDAARKLAARVKRLGWHVQLLLDVENFPEAVTKCSFREVRRSLISQL